MIKHLPFTHTIRERKVFCLKRKKRHEPQKNFMISDGSADDFRYGVNEYGDFISNGMTDNEKVEAQEYFERFLQED